LQHNYQTGPRDGTKEAELWGERKDFWEDYYFIAEDEIYNTIAEAEKIDDPDERIAMIKGALIDTLVNYPWIHPDYGIVHNPYGVMATFTYPSLRGYANPAFMTSGYYRLWWHMYSEKREASVDLHTMGKVHEFKTGLKVRYYHLGSWYNSLPWSSTPFWDYYNYKPVDLAAYIQGRLDFEGLFLRGGMRFDYFNPKAQKRKHPENLLSEEWVDAKVKYKFSPRLAFSFPITERSKIRFNYGQFFQTPPMRMIYLCQISEVALRGNQIIGDPDLSAKKTTIYEVGYENAFTEDFGLNLTAFFKDVYDMEGTREVFALPVSYTIITNVEYGNIRGFEVALIKRLSNYWRSRISYALQFARGTASDAWEGYYNYVNAAPDPITGQHPPFPKIDYPLDFDQRHTFHFDFGLVFDEKFPLVALRDFNANWIASFQSGMPYTKIDMRGNPLGDKNSSYKPGFWNVDMRVSKSIKFGLPRLTLIFQVYNLFNTEQWLDVYPSSGEPDWDGKEFTPGMFIGKLTVFDRDYHPSADADHDGYITNVEYFEAYMRARKDILDDPANYGPPRIIRFGVELSF
ncbi:MAG TPA: hypothetical protein EYP24_06005, partial [bacterium (Candidatus Stahlbacteria)]|nr:hypothetical protein [Candidatus Stahlbacteria bacterium]